MKVPQFFIVCSLLQIFFSLFASFSFWDNVLGRFHYVQFKILGMYC